MWFADHKKLKVRPKGTDLLVQKGMSSSGLPAIATATGATSSSPAVNCCSMSGCGAVSVFGVGVGADASCSKGAVVFFLATVLKSQPSSSCHGKKGDFLSWPANSLLQAAVYAWAYCASSFSKNGRSRSIANSKRTSYRLYLPASVKSAQLAVPTGD